MFPKPRRRSIDSSDSDLSYNVRMKDKKEYETNRDTMVQFPSSHGSPAMPQFPSGPDMPQFPSGSGSPGIHLPFGPGSPQFPSDHAPTMPQFPSDHSPAMPQFPPSHAIDQKSPSGTLSSPPPYAAAIAPPPSGFRLPLSTTGDFPDSQTLGPPPCYDADGSPIYIGSALMGNSVHPCKIGRHLQPYVAVPYGGAEYGHHGRYDLLPFKPDQMEFVPTSNGWIPRGRRPIEGGYEDHGEKLYHAAAFINGVRVPGKTAEHLGACNVAFGGAEHVIQSNYDILCWR